LQTSAAAKSKELERVPFPPEAAALRHQSCQEDVIMSTKPHLDSLRALLATAFLVTSAAAAGAGSLGGPLEL
jgi:hypothetical protein